MQKILFTGASGFLGHNILPLLKRQYSVVTLGITEEDDIQANIAKEVPAINEHYDYVLHAAGKAHVVPRTEAEKQAFFDVNYQGTINLCLSFERNNILPRAIVFVSTVAVYGCETGCEITEEHPLDGTTPYAKSKIMAEEFLTKWCSEHNVKLAIIRPSLLAGHNAPGNLGAMVNAIKRGFYLNIGGGNVKKSILMVDDIAKLFPLLIDRGGVYNVCDTRQPTFGQLADSISCQLKVRKPISIPYWIALIMAKIGDIFGSKAPINTPKLQKITTSLTFSNEKIRRELGWEPMDVLTNYKI